MFLSRQRCPEEIIFKMMEDAKSRGFEVVLVYIGTQSVEIKLARIAKRVFGGGHHVLEVDVRRRYDRSLKNLPVAAKLADHVLLFDNSTEQGYQLAGVIFSADRTLVRSDACVGRSVRGTPALKS